MGEKALAALMSRNVVGVVPENTWSAEYDEAFAAEGESEVVSIL